MPTERSISAHRLDRRGWRGAIKVCELLGRGECRPFRRPHARDAPAFLIDQDRHVIAPTEIAQRVSQTQQLVLILAIAPEQDEARRLGVTEETALRVAQRRSFQPVDRRLH
jgi:hypothetical protein